MPDLTLVFPSATKKELFGLKDQKTEKKGGKKEDKDERLPPLGLATLAAYIRERGFTVELLEPVSMGMSEEDVIAHIRENDPKVIGFSVLTPMFHKAAEEMGRNAKERIGAIDYPVYLERLMVFLAELSEGKKPQPVNLLSPNAVYGGALI